MDSLKRSIVKALSWRVIGTLLTSLLLFIATGNFIFALGFGLVDTVVKLIVYFVHERIWNKIKFGTDIDKPDL